MKPYTLYFLHLSSGAITAAIRMASLEDVKYVFKYFADKYSNYSLRSGETSCRLYRPGGEELAFIVDKHLSFHDETMFMAIGQNDAEWLYDVIQKGADVNVEIGKELTPVFYAISMNHTDCVKTLIEAGADVSARTKGGAVAYDFCKSHEMQMIIDGQLR